MQIPVNLLRQREERFPASEQQIADIKQKIRTEDGPTLDGPVQMALRKQMIQQVAPDPLDAFERYID